MAISIRPVVSAPLGKQPVQIRCPSADALCAAACCTILSIFGVVILVGMSFSGNRWPFLMLILICKLLVLSTLVMSKLSPDQRKTFTIPMQLQEHVMLRLWYMRYL